MSDEKILWLQQVLEAADAPCDIAPGDWFSARRVGASTVAKLVGANPFEREPALSCYEEALGYSSFTGSPAAEWGKRLEPWLVRDLSELTGLEFAHFGEVCLVHRERDHETSSPDAIAWHDGEIVGGEIKTTTMRREAEWGPSGTEDCRQDAWVQSQWNMHLTGAGRWFVLAFFRDTCTNRLYEIPRDDVTIRSLRHVAKSFWSHVERRVPPHPTQWGAPQHERKAKAGRVSWKPVAEAYAERIRLDAAAAVKVAEALAAEAKGTAHEQTMLAAAEETKRRARGVTDYLAAVVEDNRAAVED